MHGLFSGDATNADSIAAYGLVFRMQSDLLVQPTQYRNNVKGEWRSLAAANGLLSTFAPFSRSSLTS